MRMIPAIAVGEACKEVADRWEGYMRAVWQAVQTDKWKSLELPERLTRDMLGIIRVSKEAADKRVF